MFVLQFYQKALCVLCIDLTLFVSEVLLLWSVHWADFKTKLRAIHQSHRLSYDHALRLFAQKKIFKILWYVAFHQLFNSVCVYMYFGIANVISSGSFRQTYSDNREKSYSEVFSEHLSWDWFGLVVFSVPKHKFKLSFSETTGGQFVWPTLNSLW